MQMLPTQPGEPFGWFTGWGRAGPERRQTGSGPGSSMHMYLYDINYKGWENLELAAPVSGTPKNALNMFNNKQQQNKTKIYPNRLSSLSLGMRTGFGAEPQIVALLYAG